MVADVYDILQRQRQELAQVRDAFDEQNTDAHDETMTTPSKEEINARLEAVEARVETRLVSIESKMDAQFAELKSEIHKSTADTIKWVAGIVATTMALGLTVMTFVLNNAVPKAPSAGIAPTSPVTIYTQPMPAPVTPTAGRSESK